MRKNSWAGKSLKVTVEEQAGGCVEGHMARHPHTYRVTLKEGPVLPGSADGLSSMESSEDVQSTVASI